MSFNLSGKNVIVTGAGSGIGKATARVFGKAGAQVFVADINKENADATVSEIKHAGGTATAIVVNVTSQSEVQQAFRQVGCVDVLVNSAGISHIGTLETTASEDFEKIFNVNVKGVYNCMYAAIPMMKQGSVILNLASVASSVGIPDRFAYSMSKGAVRAMTLSVAKDYIARGIRCNCISPARVHTPFVDGFLAKNYPGRETEMFEKLSKTQPIGRMAKPEEIAHLILYLCSDEAGFITGCDYPIDGGFIKLNN
ncbi:MAG: SDR family oxidoreductase [Chitinophagaceae bacterium]|jgi:NAD(P)-dependent dehydrogenase (short-subunit alcohol dehydrogenase family)|nr:SDR family oxidoreductase [Chitinophagaceae bacterium]